MKSKELKYSILTLGAMLAALQLIAGPEKSNPPVDPARKLEARTEVPPEVASILERACRDCHSNETAWPLYSYVAPMSWLVRDHVNHGRKHLNFSNWAQQGGHRGEAPADDQFRRICEEVRTGKMPLPSYTLIHRQAKLTPADVDVVCAWTAAVIPSHLSGAR